MKKIIAALALLGTSPLFALPVLNPGDPALLKKGVIFEDNNRCYSLKVGYLGDFCADRKCKDLDGSVNKFSYYSNSGMLIFNAWDALDLFGYVGTLKYQYQNIQKDTFKIDHLVKAESDANLVWGVGIKAILWKQNFGNCGSTYFGIDAKYQILQPSSMARVWIDSERADPNHSSYRLRDAQVSMGVSQKWNYLAPYFAIKWTHIKGTENKGAYIKDANALFPHISLYRLESANHFGYTIGVSLLSDEKFSATAEISFVDENAFSVSAQLRF